jgi:hypothetical protein
MIFDVSLPLAVFLITAAVLFLHTKFGQKVKSLLGGKELTTRHTVLLVIMMGIMITVLGWTIIQIPDMAIMVLFLYAYSMTLFLFTYLVIPKWYLAVLTPAFFIALYVLFRGTYVWEAYLLNIFAIIFAICISVYMGGLFSWKTTTLFVVLLTLMDIVQVLITGFMVESSQKMIALQLPVMISVPTFPSEGYIMRLGLGDIFLSGLLSIQTMQKYGKKFGLVSVAFIAVVFLLFETVLINFNVGFFPATVFVISGWLAALGARYLYKSLS